MKFKFAPIVAGIVGAVMAIQVCTYKSDTYLKDHTVQLYGAEGGSCSGTQIRTSRGHDYILTAGHCISLQNAEGQIKVQPEHARPVMRKVIAEDEYSDLLLLEGLDDIVGLDIADSARATEEVRTFTHGHAFDIYKTTGVLIQDAHITVPVTPITCPEEELQCTKMAKNQVKYIMFGVVCALDVVETVMTAFTTPGSSGGLVVNSSGDLVGVVSAGDGSFSYIVTIKDIKKFLAKY